MKQDLRKFSDGTVLVRISEREFAVLQLIRQKKYRKLEIEIKGGEVAHVDVEEEIPIAGEIRLEEIVQSKSYQTVSFTRHDGQLVRIKRRIPIKLCGGDAEGPEPTEEKPSAGA